MFGKLTRRKLLSTPLAFWERHKYEDNAWVDPYEHRPDQPIADVTTRPDLHQQVFETRLGKRSYEDFNEEQYKRDKYWYKVEQQKAEEGEEGSNQKESAPSKGPEVDTSMTDAPEIDYNAFPDTPSAPGHITYTPPQGWRPSERMNQGLRAGILKPERPYQHVPEHLMPEPPVSSDISELIQLESPNGISTNTFAAYTPYLQSNERIVYTQQVAPLTFDAPSFAHQAYQAYAQDEQAEDEQAEGIEIPELSYALSSQQHTSPPQSLATQQQQAPIQQAFFEEQVSPPQHRASPPQKHDLPLEQSSSPPQQQISPPRKIITPTRRLAPFQNRATNTYPNLSAQPEVRNTTLPPIDPLQDRALRRIGGMIVHTVFDSVTGFFTGIWNRIWARRNLHETEIVAVETNTSGRKRRAVAGVDTPSPQAGDKMPGEFPETEDSASKTEIPENVPQSTMTPPESRPGSSHQQWQAPDMTSEIERQARNKARTEAQRRAREELSGLATPAAIKRYPNLSAMNRRGRTYANLRVTPLHHPRPLPIEARRPTAIEKREVRNKRADTAIDDLIQRAKQVAIETPDQKSLRESFRTRKQRVEDEKAAKEREEQAEVEAEKARLEAEAAEEEARKKADEEAAEEAARQKIRDQLVRPLDPEWDEKVMEAMSTTNGGKVLAKSAEGVDLTRSILGRVYPQKNQYGESMERTLTNTSRTPGPDEWLDDEAVNAFIAGVVARKKEQTGYVKGPKNTPAFESYGAAWYKNYTGKGPGNKKGIETIKTWSRRKGIQGEKLLLAERIFFPINTGSHWLLLVISPQDRKIEVLDSMNGRTKPFFKIAREWLKMELGDKYDADEWEESQVESESQMNMNDCGVFTCINALASAKGREPKAVESTNGMDDARRMMVAIFLNGGFKDDFEL